VILGLFFDPAGNRMGAGEMGPDGRTGFLTGDGSQHCGIVDGEAGPVL
jgi:hypothetical protein